MKRCLKIAFVLLPQVPFLSATSTEGITSISGAWSPGPRDSFLQTNFRQTDAQSPRDPLLLQLSSPSAESPPQGRQTMYSRQASSAGPITSGQLAQTGAVDPSGSWKRPVQGPADSPILQIFPSLADYSSQGKVNPWPGQTLRLVPLELDLFRPVAPGGSTKRTSAVLFDLNAEDVELHQPVPKKYRLDLNLDPAESSEEDVPGFLGSARYSGDIQALKRIQTGSQGASSSLQQEWLPGKNVGMTLDHRPPTDMGISQTFGLASFDSPFWAWLSVIRMRVHELVVGSFPEVVY
ncbi:uncharacterized protein PGTG_21139 [Puccinia graminis f. sp. tritici CRL 75-36-700-3]|uniref:Uncharacterized protein n=1 Tax=Puccinia graminis f. sp. tritici (strain CRL 75-36-700-3 / race SCCL) TaxID=418459 RepID=H6QQS0_PUCGT|nr:uncharacterized protein PGTG_21139 [Puccinia graminis f. sp. tritici CRL 75-36-700-3]EHS62818.1 hypothetical protein PGTG_21139 [Puccinia graminis f. sp. tritici CRL 75-36-700-3]